MKLLALLATLAAVSAQSPETIYKNFLRGIDAAKKTCMQLDEGEHESSEETSSEEDLPRSRRQVEELAGFQESVDEFAAQFADFQGGLSSSISNLSCVLKGLQMLKHDGSVNLDFWTTALTDPEKAVFDYTIEGSAASDPVWRQRFSEANLECYVLSQSFPADSLTHDPVSATLGRPAIFFKCWNKVERRLCAEAEMLEWLEKIYGPTQPDTLQQLGLPADKFAAAGIAAAEPEEGRFVDEFMWRMDDPLQQLGLPADKF